MKNNHKKVLFILAFWVWIYWDMGINGYSGRLLAGIYNSFGREGVLVLFIILAVIEYLRGDKK